MELNSTIINEEDKEYYEAWVKSDKNKKKLNSPYLIIWDGGNVLAEKICFPIRPWFSYWYTYMACNSVCCIYQKVINL